MITNSQQLETKLRFDKVFPGHRITNHSAWSDFGPRWTRLQIPTKFFFFTRWKTIAYYHDGVWKTNDEVVAWKLESLVGKVEMVDELW